MPTEPDDLIDVVPDADLLAEAVEHHLDAHPLPVDEAEVDRVTARIAARIAAREPRRPWLPWAAVPVLAAAAGALWLARVGIPFTGTADTSGLPDAPAAVLHAEPEQVPAAVPVLAPTDGLAGRPILVEGDTTLLTSSTEGVGVLLVQEGEAIVDDTPIPAGHWAVVPHPEATLVVFPDGEPPPIEVSAPVQQQLEDVRWRALPPRTHDALDRLLEDR